MATMAQEMFKGMADLYGSVRTTRRCSVLRYAHQLLLNDFGWTAEVTVDYWYDDDDRVECEVLGVTLLSADGSKRQPVALAMFSEDALAEMRDEIAGELEASHD